MEIKQELGSILTCTDAEEELLCGRTMELVGITFTYMGQNGKLLEKKFLGDKESKNSEFLK